MQYSNEVRVLGYLFIDQTGKAVPHGQGFDMRIGVIARRFVGKPFGIGRYIEHLLKHWDKQKSTGEEFVLFVPESVDRKDVKLSEAFRYEIVQPNIQGIVWENVILPSRLKQVDVLFGPSYTIPLVSPVPTVVATHSVNEVQSGAHPWWYNYSYRMWYKTCAKRANHVIVPSESAFADVQEQYGIHSDKMHVVREGVDESFKPVTDQQVLRATREKYFGSNRPFILFVGKQSQRRNIPNLIRAFAKVKKTLGIDHGLLLHGPNILDVPITEIARAEGVVDDVVQLDEDFENHHDITSVYSAASLYVYPSTYDGFSLTVVEAMACGLPVIAIDRAAITEILSDCAILLKEPSVELLADAIRRGLTDVSLREKLISAGLCRADTLRWNSTAAETLDVIKKAAR